MSAPSLAGEEENLATDKLSRTESLKGLDAIEVGYFAGDANLSFRGTSSDVDRAVPDAALAALDNAIGAGSPRASCLRLWSRFVRLRDGFHCVRCGNRWRVSAHHVCRRSLMPEAAFQIGNGITLCENCHRDVHRGYSGHPGMNMPMDAEGGEKISIMEDLYGRLFVDGDNWGLLDSN